MSNDNSTLGTFYQGWNDYLSALETALRPLTDEQLALRPSPDLRSIGEIAGHMVAARARWVHELMGEGGSEMAGLATWDRAGQPARSAAELVAALRQSWRVLLSALGRWTESDMAETFAEQVDGQEYRFPRSWVVWHLIEHDVYHGGEISLALGMHGLTAPDI
jgi:uncharacterized damage-inducible protein DinB